MALLSWLSQARFLSLLLLSLSLSFPTPLPVVSSRGLPGGWCPSDLMSIPCWSRTTTSR